MYTRQGYDGPFQSTVASLQNRYGWGKKRSWLLLWYLKRRTVTTARREKTCFRRRKKLLLYQEILKKTVPLSVYDRTTRVYISRLSQNYLSILEIPVYRITTRLLQNYLSILKIPVYFRNTHLSILPVYDRNTRILYNQYIIEFPVHYRIIRLLQNYPSFIELPIYHRTNYPSILPLPVGTFYSKNDGMTSTVCPCWRKHAEILLTGSSVTRVYHTLVALGPACSSQALGVNQSKGRLMQNLTEGPTIERVDQ